MKLSGLWPIIERHREAKLTVNYDRGELWNLWVFYRIAPRCNSVARGMALEALAKGLEKGIHRPLYAKHLRGEHVPMSEIR